MFIINGIAERCDGNFMSAFGATKLPETDVGVGPYPGNGEDAAMLHKNGYNAVLNLLTDR
jgi:hypothetical protein